MQSRLNRQCFVEGVIVGIILFALTLFLAVAATTW